MHRHQYPRGSHRLRFQAGLQHHIDTIRSSFRPLAVLVTRSDTTSHVLLSDVIQHRNRRILATTGNTRTIRTFHRRHPRLILVSTVVPIVSNFRTTRRVGALTKRALIPVVFLASLARDRTLTQYLRTNNSSFLTGPCGRIVLTTGVGTVSHLHHLRTAILRRHSRVTGRRRCLLGRRHITGTIFSGITRSNYLGTPGVHCLRSPCTLFGNSLLLTTFAPTNSVRILLNSFAKRNLPTTINTVPLTRIFCNVATGNCNLSRALQRVGTGLGHVLPISVFYYTVLLYLDFRDHSIRI